MRSSRQTPCAHLPAFVGPSERRHERREHHRERQAIGQHDVDQHVDRIGAALGGDVGDRPPDQRLRRRARARRRSRAARAARSRRARGEPLRPHPHGASRASPGRRSPVRRSSGLSATTSRQPGRSSSMRLARSRMRSGKRERDDVRACCGGVVARGELLLVDLRGGEAPEQVPVQRPVGRQRHVGHQLDAIGADLAHRGDELERRPFVVAYRACERQELVVRRGAGRHRVAVAVGVRLAERRRHAERPARHRLVRERDHRRDLLRAWPRRAPRRRPSRRRRIVE